MRNFGAIIRYFRTQSNISMSCLAEGICTKHYVYLIESGKRIPSIKIIDELSAKLNFDWRDYVEYANISSPVEAKDLIDRMERYFKAFQTEKLCELLNNLPDEPYIEAYPIKIEIWIYKINVCIYESEEKINNIQSVKESFKAYFDPLALRHSYSAMPIVYLKALNAYASLLSKEKNKKEALLVYQKLIETLEQKKDIVRYQALYIKVYQSVILYYSQCEDYKKMLAYAAVSMKYQEEKCLLERYPLTIIFMGDAYKGLQNRSMAFKYYKRAITVSRIIKNEELCNIAEKHISKLY